MKKIIILTTFLIFTIVTGCNSKKGQSAIESKKEKLPGNVKVLLLEGPRPKDNVIHNIIPVVNHWCQQCSSILKTDCKGSVTIDINVTNLGEIGVKKFSSESIDSSFVESIVNGIYMHDFDPWNDDLDDTRIVYTIHFSND